MAERLARVAGCTDGWVQLQVEGQCSDCAGCGGRCNLFRNDEQGRIELPLTLFTSQPEPGERVELQLSDRWLRQTAWQVYGLTALGLLIGAGIGHALALWLETSPDVIALIGAISGTFVALRASKARLPEVCVARIAASTAAMKSPATVSAKAAARLDESAL